MSILIQFAAGLVFGIGLIVAGMSDPAKVLNFLDLGAIPSGGWDASLLFVLAWPRPLLAERFSLPAAGRPDARLLTGAALFGIGWGLAGFCPGPALVATLTGGMPALVFLAAMLAGMTLARWRASAKAPLPMQERGRA